ncbi:MAG: NAD(P)/FAD-dependent oxidoreductase [Planctomycetes bacterium]|nr:NAD(P)/FAD-dependent oxidoreductase [Planctomycetota bacterium]
MAPPLPIGILGAGPAGATLARILAVAGHAVVLVDAEGPHEKPCGGGVTARGWRGRPILLGSSEAYAVLREAVVESGGESVAVPLAEPVRVYPRVELNRVLFEAALGAGARFVRARATGLARTAGGFRIELEDTPDLDVGFLAGADGAAGVSRKLLGGGRGRERFALALGFRAEREGDLDGDPVPPMRIAFPPGLAGYAWVFPRPDHLSVGICSRDPSVRPDDLRRRLADVFERSGAPPPAIPGSDYSFPVPDFRAFEGPRAGCGWALLGDAGAFVDPLTLEGIPYALRSAELLAQAILAGEPEHFERAWRADFGRELALAARALDRFYAEGFTEDMVRRARRSERLRRILGELLAGAAGYRGLRRRILAALALDGAARVLGVLPAPRAPSR